MKKLFAFFFFSILIAPVFSQKQVTDCNDSIEIVHVNKIYLSGNKITHDKIIYRELAIKAGDSLCYPAFMQSLKKSKENLKNTSLFNFVEIRDIQVVNKGKRLADVHINVSERWYIWPMPILELAERNPNAWWETKELSKINYGMFFTWENFRGRREALKIMAQGGYDEKFVFYYDIPFIDKLQTLGIIFGIGLTRNHEVTYQTINNRPVRFRDIEYIRHQYYANITLNIRKNIYTSHSFKFAYDDHQYGIKVFELNPQFDPNQNTIFKYFSLSYAYRNDHRDNKSYPLNGYYIDAILSKQGLGISSKANVDQFMLSTKLRKYWNLDNQWYLGAGFTGRVANTGLNPYFLNTGLGYHQDFVRGYELYVIDAESFALVKTDLKYALFQDRINSISFLPSKFSKFHWSVYLSFFLDAAYSTTELPQMTNSLQNELLVGYGAGINFVTYYDMVFRFEYSYNDKLKEKGFFMSFVSSL